MPGRAEGVCGSVAVDAYGQLPFACNLTASASVFVLVYCSICGSVAVDACGQLPFACNLAAPLSASVFVLVYCSICTCVLV
jgi:hypothetical protein